MLRTSGSWAMAGPGKKSNSLHTEINMKILILGAAGQIGKLLTADLLAQTQHDIVLYARDANRRLKNTVNERVTLVEGEFKDANALSKAIASADVIYLNDMNDKTGVETIVDTMKKHAVKRIIAASILGIYDEVPGAFGAWNKRMVGIEGIKKHAANASLLAVDEFDYTLLRLTWLYNQKGNRKYHLTQANEPFEGAQVTREAVSQLIIDIIEDPTGKFNQTSLGVSEPDTNWDKPSFY
jgi:nucleoside-diphosphate-sugar epimerase